MMLHCTDIYIISIVTFEIFYNQFWHSEELLVAQIEVSGDQRQTVLISTQVILKSHHVILKTTTKMYANLTFRRLVFIY